MRRVHRHGAHLAILAMLLAPAAWAEEPPPADGAPRQARADLGVFLVPYGMAYTRAAAAAQVAYQIPLSQDPGILWSTTNVTVGVSNLYGFVNDSAAAFVEVTPIALFKLRIGGYDVSSILDPFNGGVRLLTPQGRTQLAAGQVGRGLANGVDWELGQDDRAIFQAPLFGGGLRLKVMPMLQAKFGPVGIQYNFTADWNFYSAGGSTPDDIFHDSVNFTLRRMHGFLQQHELVVACDLPIGGREAFAGVAAHYLRPGGGPEVDCLGSLGVNALLFYRPDFAVFGKKASVWGAAQVGTYLVDPMFERAFSWVVALGYDWQML